MNGFYSFSTGASEREAKRLLETTKLLEAKRQAWLKGSHLSL